MNEYDDQARGGKAVPAVQIARVRDAVRDYTLAHYLARARRIKKWEKALQRGGAALEKPRPFVAERRRAGFSLTTFGEKKCLGYETQAFAPLLARYSFKIAWLYEFQQNKDKALRHYRAAYATLAAIAASCFSRVLTETVEGSCLKVSELAGQLKGVADYANFKICRLALQAAKVPQQPPRRRTHERESGVRKMIERALSKKRLAFAAGSGGVWDTSWTPKTCLETRVSNFLSLERRLVWNCVGRRRGAADPATPVALPHPSRVPHMRELNSQSIEF